MKLSRLLSLGLTVAGGVAAGRVLVRRHQWEQTHNRVAICVDYDDAQAAAIRAGLSFDALLGKLAAHGATHVSLPEWTLNRLLATGQLTPQAPARPFDTPPDVGHWNYLHGPAGLIQPLAEELAARLPYTEARVVEQTTLAFAGDRPTIGEIGLGFDAEVAAQIKAHGLGVVPRPVSYAWPEKDLLERTLAQAAQHGPLVAFAGDMILGHEMHLDETLDAMADNDLSLVYFAESRHQKGDWFIAKRRAPHVVLAHRFTPQEMVPLDYHAASHNWANLARERGIRFCYVNFFRVLHATEPLEGLHYLDHLKGALEGAGFVVSRDVTVPQPVPEPSAAELAATGLAPAGVAATAAQTLLPLPDSLAIPLTLAAAGGAAALPFVEQAYNRAKAGQHDHDHSHEHDHPHDHHHHEHGDHAHHHRHGNHADHDHGHDHDHPDLHALYPPSYAPKLLALAATALAPIAANPPVSNLQSQISTWLSPAAAAAALAAATSGQEYHLRIETYRGFNLDWLLPLAAAAQRVPHRGVRAGVLAALAGGWWLARQRGLEDPLARFDSAHAEGHTHHISAAMRLVGDVGLLLGPQPARKWAGLGPLAQAASAVLARKGYENAAAAAGFAAAAGYVLGLVGFRRPERALATTLKEAAPSFGLGTGVGMLLLLLANGERLMVNG